jgi:hypothetical protein
MSQPKLFTEADLNKAPRDAGSKLGRRIAGYLIGGCVMTFLARKAATKDVDHSWASACSRLLVVE